jgi:sugar lactone lactonase YvrE
MGLSGIGMILLTVLFLYSVSLFAQAPGTIQTIAGMGSSSFSGDGGPANLATLNVAVDVAADNAGNLFIADQFNHRIRKIAPDGTISTVAGTGAPGYSGDGGPAVNAQINTPTGICADASGNLYIADVGNQRIRKVDGSGTITTLAGNGSKGYGGDGGPAINASFYNAVRVVVDPSGNVIVADQSNHRLREITPDGNISTLAGTGVGTPANGAFSGDGGPAASAALNNPTAVTVDANGVVYFADQFNHRIRQITPDGTITTIAGNGSPGFAGDGGPATAASLNYPGGITVDGNGNLYFNDDINYRTRRIAADGTIGTIAGSGAPGFSGDGGAATAASLNGNFGITLDLLGNLYIADSMNNRIREVYAVVPGLTMGMPKAAQ